MRERSTEATTNNAIKGMVIQVVFDCASTRTAVQAEQGQPAQ